MRKALALVAVAALSFGLASTSEAAVKPKPKPKLPVSKPLTVTDPAGDANAINDQDELLPAAPPEQSTPQGQRTAGDIVSWSVGRMDDGKAVTGIVASMTLSAAPDQGTDYRIQASTPTCPYFWFELQWTPGLGQSAYLRNDCAKNGTTVFDKIVELTIKDKTITWTLPLKNFPAGVKLGQVMTVPVATSNGCTAVIVPVLDQSKNDKTYKLGD